MRLTMQALLAMRMQKKRPDGWVIVSLLGDLPAEQDAVIVPAERIENADWRPVTALDVIVFYKSDTRHDALIETLNSIIRVHPNTLACWMVDKSIGVDLVEYGTRCFKRWEAKREADWEIFNANN